MSPSPRSKASDRHGPGRRAWPAALAALAAVGAAVPVPASGQGSGPVPVTASVVVEREVEPGDSFVGTIRPVRASTVGSAAEERVVEFPVNEGDRVERGQVLARLRTTTLEIELEGARAELEARRQELAEMENGSRPEEIERARAQLGEAEALMNLTAAQRRRMEDLFRKGQASVEELDSAVSAAEQAVQARRSAQANLDLVLEGPRAEQIARSRALVDVQQQVIRRLEEQKSEHTITAPFAGYVVAEHTEIGQWVRRGDPIVEVAELDHVDVMANVSQDDIRYVRPGVEARVQVRALPEETFLGEVAFVVPQADLRARTFPVMVRVENREAAEDVALLKSGMLAEVTLPVGERKRSLLVHKDALVLGGPSPVVYAIDPSGGDGSTGTVRPVPVRPGVASGGLIAVEGALEVGQRVVVQGNERLRPGQPVQVVRDLDPDDPGPVASASD